VADSIMTDKTQKFDYLDEHLPYMLKMMRHNFKKINENLFYLDWNAFLESFAVNARNLVQFLDNRDTGNFMARSFVSDFRIRKGDIQGAMKKLDEQVFHLAKNRSRGAEGKFNTAYAKKVFDWIESGMSEFIEALSPDEKNMWNAQKADPESDKTSISRGYTGAGGPPSASAAISTTSSTTSSMKVYTTSVPHDDKKKS
jgi:hypothetical protein